MTQMEKLANRTDRKLREHGWATISRHLERGEPNAIGIEDLCYYICHSSTNLRANKKDHITDYCNSLTSHKKKAEQACKNRCDKIVNDSSSSLQREDAATYNKIRIHNNSLAHSIATAKAQSQRLVELSQITNTVVVDVDTRILNLEDLLNKVEKAKSGIPVEPASDEKMATLIAKIEKQEERIKTLEEAADGNGSCLASVDRADLGNVKSKGPLPDNVESTAPAYCQPISPKPHTNSMLNTLSYPPHQCMSRVQIRNALMASLTGWLLSYTVRDGQYFYHISTNSGTDIFAFHSEIIEVKEFGDPNNFLYGYNPTRNMSIFETPAAQQNTNSATAGSPVRHQGFVPQSPVQHQAAANSSIMSPAPKSKSLLFPLVNPSDIGREDDYSLNGTDDDKSVRDRKYTQRPMLNHEYSHPIGTAITRVREDKVEELHSSMKVVLSDTDSIRAFYDELRRRLKPQNIHLREWSSLAPAIDVLDMQPNQCANYQNVRVVMSRAIFNLLDSNKETLITDLYMSGELSMYDEQSDGFGFITYMVSQSHQKYRHQVVQPSISATLTIPTFEDHLTIHEFCSNVKNFLENGLAPDHFTPFAAVQYVLEKLRLDSRFTTGCAYLQTEVTLHNNKTGYAPPHLQLQLLPRTILNQYEPAIKSELSKPRRMGARRVEFDTQDSGLVAHRAYTRSDARESGNNENPRVSYQKKSYSNQRGGHDKKPYGKRNDNDSYSNRRPFNKERPFNKDQNARGADIPYKACPCCGKPGHEECDCRQKGSFVHLSQWYEMLSKSQRQDIIKEMNKNSRATHERYKAAYGKRNAVRKRLNRVHTDFADHDNLEINIEKEIVLQACRAQIPDLDFGSLDQEFIDDVEPYLEFDPDVDSAEYISQE